ncbi:MAG TPA: hypothetical protein VGF17_29660 [Phytomonospora sp.]
MPRNSGAFATAILAPIVVVACCVFAIGRGGTSEEPVGTADPAEVAARLAVRLDTATAAIGLPLDGSVFYTGRCDAPNFEVAPDDRFVLVARYHYTPEVSAQNDDVIGLYEHWETLGWGPELHFVAETGLADAEAEDAGDAFRAATDWRETSVAVSSPCYRFAGEPVWGEVTPADVL